MVLRSGSGPRHLTGYSRTRPCGWALNSPNTRRLSSNETAATKRSMMNSAKTRRTSGLNPLNATLAVVALLLLALVVPAGAEPGNDNRAPDVGDCEELQVDAGHKVAFHAYAEGVQIYRWNGTSWAFVGPEAVLFTEGLGVVGIHYGGPTWESNSGSKVVGTVLERCPKPDAIPWLKLAAASNEAPGIF